VRVKNKSVIYILIIALVYPGLLMATGEAAVYKVFVDEDYGFLQVRELNNTPFVYKNLTLNINAGDTVIWTNDATDNSEMTIVSVQNLWDNKSAYLRYTGRSFNYTFNEPGTYSVYLKENIRRVRPQTIVVSSIETPTPTTPAPTETPVPTPIPTVTETMVEPQSATFNLWYILIAVLAVAGIILYLYSGKRK